VDTVYIDEPRERFSPDAQFLPNVPEALKSRDLSETADKSAGNVGEAGYDSRPWERLLQVEPFLPTRRTPSALKGTGPTGFCRNH
jgi:hypothetical protein